MMTAQEKSLKIEVNTIQESVGFYENQIQLLLQKIDKLEKTSWHPKFEQKMEQIHKQIIQLINKLHYEQRQMLNFEIKMNEFAVKQFSNKIKIIFNPNKYQNQNQKPNVKKKKE